jgi:Uma2 family endonuclease
MTAAKPIDLVSIDDYLAGELASDAKHEYLGGRIYAMAGARNVHNKIAVAFVSIMHGKLRGRPYQPFNSDTKVRVRMPTHTRFYYPDGIVVCEPNADRDSYHDHPVVIAEVISDATRRIDEGEKRDAYLTIPSLTHYLLIETDRPRIVVHVRTEGGFVPRVYEGIAAIVPLETIKAELPLADLYERVDFTAASAADPESNES